MVCLIKQCVPCANGDHDRCDNKTGAGDPNRNNTGPFIFGGHICQCNECHIRQMPERDAKFMRGLQRWLDMFNVSRKRKQQEGGDDG